MKKYTFSHLIVSGLLICLLWIGCENIPAAKSPEKEVVAEINAGDTLKRSDSTFVEAVIFDENEYKKRVMALCHDSITKRWPANSVVPVKGAILPFNRVVAYYGNFYSKNMGILGTMSEEKLINSLFNEVRKWEETDKSTPVLPAIHYIAITAQNKPGKGYNYRLRMPEKQIMKAISLAHKVKGITFLDIQVGHSTVQHEVPSLEQFLIKPDVHLGLDPEWSMKDGSIPGRKIGTMDAADINFAVDYLSALVKKHHLPPKILVVHRFTKGMITNSDKIRKTPEVQIVINMDGFGFPAKKIDSYRRFVSGYPVQFTGFKLFYKNDIKTKPYRMMSPNEILNLYPRPIYIQYQ